MERRTLTCYCCGDHYPYGEWRCCAPMGGMASHEWLAKYCAPVKEGGCGKCPRHCRCPQATPKRRRSASPKADARDNSLELQRTR